MENITKMKKEIIKEEVLDYMEEHKKADIEELHENIECDLEILVEVVDDLIKEGKIGEDK